MKKLLALLFALFAAPAAAQTIPAGPFGSLNYWGVGGLSQVLNPGLAGQCLQTQAVGSAPIWATCFVIPPQNANTILANVTTNFVAPQAVDINRVLDTVGYDIARPPAPQSIIYKSNVGPLFNWQALPPGTPGQVLQSAGPVNPPFWASLGQATLASICQTPGAILYFDVASLQWLCLAPGTAGQLLQTGGPAANPSWSSITPSGVTSIGTQSGALTIPGGNLASTVIPVPRYDAAQSLGIIANAQLQSNLNLPSIHRRPLTPWLPKWGIARANVLAGVSNAKLLCIGDSTFAGTGAQPGNVNVAPFAFPAQLAVQLTANGLNASSQSRWSDNNFILSGPGLATADSRVTLGAWGSGGFNTLGGVLLGVAATGSPFTFTPATAVDSFDFYYSTNTGQGSLTLSINGGGTTAVNENVAASIAKVTKTGTLGASTLTVQQSSSTGVFFIGIVAYNSAAKEVSVINAGAGSATAATFADNSLFFSPIPAIGLLAPDLTIIDLTINDSIHTTALSTYQTNLQAVITEAKISGDVILLGGVPIQTSSATLAVQIAVNNMAAALAAKNSVNYVSMFDLWGSEAAIATAGWSFDGIHLTGAGYAAQAALIAPYLQ